MKRRRKVLIVLGPLALVMIVIVTWRLMESDYDQGYREGEFMALVHQASFAKQGLRYQDPRDRAVADGTLAPLSSEKAEAVLERQGIGDADSFRRGFEDGFSATARRTKDDDLSLFDQLDLLFHEWIRTPLFGNAYLGVARECRAPAVPVPPKNSTGNENDGSEAESGRETAE